MKMSLHHHPTSTHTTTETQYQQYLSYHSPDFDQTLKQGLWKHLEKIPALTVTFIQETYISMHHLSIPGLPQLELA